ncbi:MAG: thioredoxin domain-containing protein, partial [Pseudomonadota bacterium]
MVIPAPNLLSRSDVMRFTVGAALGVAALMVSVPSAQAFNADEKEEIGQIVREYLLANPELMIEVQQALEEKQEAEAADLIAKTLSASGEQLFNNPIDPVFGDADGDVTVVEFFDYNCGFCRRGLADMEYILDNDADVKFVLKEFP